MFNFGNLWPWSNMHELNLDWMLQQMNELLQKQYGLSAVVSSHDNIQDYTQAELENLYTQGTNIIIAKQTPESDVYAMMWVIGKNGEEYTLTEFEPEAYIPAVTSVNGMTGKVSLTGSNLITSDTNVDSIASSIEKNYSLISRNRETLLYGEPYNFIVNSNFLINQRDASTNVSINDYVADMWQAGNATVVTFRPSLAGNSTGITFSSPSESTYWGVDQIVRNSYEKPTMPVGTYTLRIGYLSNGEILDAVWSGVPSTEKTYINLFDGADATIQRTTDNYFLIALQGSAVTTIYYTSLYYGEYDSETIPAYVPPDYYAEYNRCKQFYCSIDIHNFDFVANTLSSTVAQANFTLPVRLFSTPTITWSDNFSNLTLHEQTTNATVTPTATSLNTINNNYLSINFNGSYTAYTTYFLNAGSAAVTMYLTVN